MVHSRGASLGPRFGPPARRGNVSSELVAYGIEARTEGNGISQVTCKDAPPLSVDTSAGQSPERFGPVELLAAAFAACTLKNLERFSHLLSFGYARATMRVVAERVDRPPRVVGLRYVLQLTSDEPPHRVDLLRRNLIKFGTVSSTLARAVEIHGEVEVESASNPGEFRSLPLDLSGKSTRSV